ncbi:MAG: serine O-acetyltransferase EpsC [Bacteriovoracaceae bacterium]
MSSKLAQFFHQKRFQTVSLQLPVPQIRQSVDELIHLLYPQRLCNEDKAPENIHTMLRNLEESFTQYFKLLGGLSPEVAANASAHANEFMNSLPNIAEILDSDVEAAYNGDPAAFSKEEVIIAYPGFYCICIHRLAHQLYQQNIPLIPRLMSEYAHEKTGIDIHPGAQIAESFFIDHGTGVVIGETSIIGRNVKIYQGVTLGALSVKKKLQNKKRHPTIEDDVVIYAASTILGGETVVGKGSIIGGNVWLTESVGPGSVVLNQLQNETK